ncbi:ABC transporter permease [Rahnella sp. Lac-M11]|uniref:ABC transporter permease n=1 Tax=Rahnella contaminans TaxID=2703882 RepID=A0A6M2B7H7_9GAMM|nr:MULTISPECIES: ABC transporter permease [Rahnella]MBU9820917.1 ABC transporter permease [Rahnella sp. BCC 1045]MCS3422019.1 osmoprotectant transport system permease protein [Rahnella sp. BIGb0603]MDF1893305.1 ABC transporter permease [Rahnella contaminans]NGX88167.1 ABC transporter permease [Rahnella contaminans]
MAHHSPVKNRVLLTLVFLLLLSGSGLAFLSHAPNRLVSGQGISLASLLHGYTFFVLLPVILLVVSAFLTLFGRSHLLVMLLAEILLAALVWLAGYTAVQLTGGNEDSIARTSLGGGFWAAAALCLLIASDAISRFTRNHTLRILLNIQMLIPVVLLLFYGQLSGLSLLKEYDNRSDVFNDALWQHLGILFGTLVPAVLIGLPVGLLCHRHVRWRGPVLSVLNIIQTVPSIALFGLLLAPLAGLAKALPWLGEHGISGIGLAPAIIALVLYSLLPLVRGVIAGLDSVPEAVIESARGMGMNRGQVFFRVQMPIALPVILTGIRIVAVQTVGMAMVAALIGAGGLGAIMFQGLLSSALDLVLLGVIPAVLMAVVVDSIFKFAVSILETSRR